VGYDGYGRGFHVNHMNRYYSDGVWIYMGSTTHEFGYTWVRLLMCSVAHEFG
ncbi:Hypothetical predicted protein, partial [Olea europaea subsp. europaea]